jgi:hypothetical protein
MWAKINGNVWKENKKEAKISYCFYCLNKKLMHKIIIKQQNAKWKYGHSWSKVHEWKILKNARMDEFLTTYLT